VAHVSYTPGGIHIEFESVEEKTEGSDEERVKYYVQEVAKKFEIGISRTPEDWHMLQRIWIDGEFVSREKEGLN
jgi:KDO2-lipid IV(A) lauroyltransferase